MAISSSSTDMIKPFFLLEKGVRPWEGADKDPLIGQFSTLTVVSPNAASIVEVLKVVFQSIVGKFPNVVRWHTTGKAECARET